MPRLLVNFAVPSDLQQCWGGLLCFALMRHKVRKKYRLSSWNCRVFRSRYLRMASTCQKLEVYVKAATGDPTKLGDCNYAILTRHSHLSLWNFSALSFDQLTDFHHLWTLRCFYTSLVRIPSYFLQVHDRNLRFHVGRVLKWVDVQVHFLNECWWHVSWKTLCMMWSMWILTRSPTGWFILFSLVLFLLLPLSVDVVRSLYDASLKGSE